MNSYPLSEKINWQDTRAAKRECRVFLNYILKNADNKSLAGFMDVVGVFYDDAVMNQGNIDSPIATPEIISAAFDSKGLKVIAGGKSQRQIR